MKKLFLLGLLLPMCFHHVKAQEATYRPIVEEGKVWKVGWIPSGSEFGNVAQVIAYFWLEEDSDPENQAYFNVVTDFKAYAKLMKEYVCSEEYTDKFPSGVNFILYLIECTGGDVGAVRRNKITSGLDELIYCFNETDYFHCYYNNRIYTSCIQNVTRGTYENGFKGMISTVISDNTLYTATFNPGEDDNPEPYYSFETKWLEGVGSVYGPYPNIIDPTITPIEWYLMECRVGDDVLYYNPDIIDGVNPPDEETKKRIDFTHIEKPRPRAPHRAATEESVSLNGEFSTRLLDLQLGDMSDTYDVIITDDADEVVYQKTVRAADVLALNIDISEWAAPSYTINVENDYEQYVGTFELTPTSIEEKYHEQSTKNNDVYDLQGRRVIDSSSERGGARRAEGSLTKGLYIINGKKVLIK